MKAKQKNGVVQNVTTGLENALLLSQAFERLLVDVVAAFVPWLAPGYGLSRLRVRASVDGLSLVDKNATSAVGSG